MEALSSTAGMRARLGRLYARGFDAYKKQLRAMQPDKQSMRVLQDACEKATSLQVSCAVHARDNARTQN